MAISFVYAPAFAKQFAKLPPEIKNSVVSALTKLKTAPDASSLRLHRLTGIKPPVWKIDVLPNKSWQIAMKRDGDKFTLLYIGTHKKINQVFRP